MRNAFLAFCLLICAPASANEPLNQIWTAALLQQQSGKLQLAKELYRSWIDEAAGMNIQSAEAYFNLASAELLSGEVGNATYHLLQAAKYTSLPWNNLQNLSLLSQVQKRIGIQQAVTEQPTFTLFLFLNENVMAYLAAFAIWSLFGIAILRKSNFFPMTNRQWMGIASAPLLLILGIGIATMAKLYLKPISVLIQEDSPIPLYTSEEITEESAPIVELPSGTIVAMGETRGESVQIVAPIAGWVKRKQIKMNPR